MNHSGGNRRPDDEVPLLRDGTQRETAAETDGSSRINVDHVNYSLKLGLCLVMRFSGIVP